MKRKCIIVLIFFNIILFCGYQETVAKTIFVMLHGDNTGDGSESKPFFAIQYALNQANNGDIVQVGEGIFTENIVWPNVNGIILSGKGEELTVIDGGRVSSVIRFTHELIDNNTIVKQLTLKNGNVMYWENEGRQFFDINENYNGGGIFCDTSSPSIENVTIKDNFANSNGGGIYCNKSMIKLYNVSIINNGVGFDGGGFYCQSSTPDLSNVDIIDNVANDDGGGIYISFNINPNFNYVTIANNIAFDNGGGIYCYDSELNISNDTITSNKANDLGGSIYINECNAKIVNSILWDNIPIEIYSTLPWISFGNGKNEVTINYSVVQEGENSIIKDENTKINWGLDNLSNNPLFVSPDNQDYHLQSTSPCVDAGNPDTDDDGTTWLDDSDDQDKDGTRKDIGALSTYNKKAIIVVGSNINDKLWPSFQKCYKDLIVYLELNEYLTKYLIPDENGAVNILEISNSILQWANDADELLLYLIDHGMNETFILDWINTNNNLTASKLDEWLDTLQMEIEGKVIVMYDACMSGSFIPKLTPPPGKERVIISSVSDEQNSIFLVKANISFSQFFWQNTMISGYSLKNAFYSSMESVNQSESISLTPQIDVNGNGIPNEDVDFQAAKHIYLCKNSLIKNSELKQYNDQAISKIDILDSSSQLFIQVNSQSFFRRVFAVIVPPSFKQTPGIPISNLTVLEIPKTDHDGIYQTTYDEFDKTGIYYINIYAEKSNGILKKIKQYPVTKNEKIFEPDAYECDDHILSSNMLDTPQQHNFHQKEDADWGMFYGMENLTYSIKVINPQKDCDAVISLYTISSKSSFLLKDGSLRGEPEMLTWTCSATGIYYVKIFNSAPNIFGNDTGYTLLLENSNAADAYEDDDGMEMARIINISNFESQYHNIHDEGDQDWVKFYGAENKHYTIKVQDAGSRLNAVLELLDQSGIVLETRNRYDEGEDENLYWFCEKSGIYYIKVSNSDFYKYGETTHYSLVIFYPEGSAPSWIVGTIIDSCTGNHLSNIDIMMNDKYAGTSYDNGTYLLPYEAGTQFISINETSYTKYSSEIILNQMETILWNINLKPENFYQSFGLEDVVIALQILANFTAQDISNRFCNETVTLSNIIFLLSSISDEGSY